mmetsp:Transcript_12877/g.24489  ORF Transcript_12877/g.24489 Transcript_12877/m.24489 type:complete len:226 (-) Transcript_12877:257-934(-)|eukprot:CAMPEP_0114260644 /NCGR_PEP_ID=MMETSP0058-20121206/20616_1 /TAXON_ID=36894 /ORGANISM="Pyramimonas parkeae, CCMP726" /LENGTH=225 /DNA_ID=CAMNT_0001375931 /DNA_START=146 /DNA_END=823 /DNA_ORIENTATION=+
MEKASANGLPDGQVDGLEGLKRKRDSSPDRSLCCTICHEVLLDPVCMPCGHVYDAGCMRRLLTTCPKAAQRCPTCRASLPVYLPAVCTVLRDLVEATHPDQLAERRESAKAAKVEAGEGDSFFQTDTEVNTLRERASRELHEAIFTELGPHLPANHVLRQRVARSIQSEQDIEVLRGHAVTVLEEELRAMHESLRNAESEARRPSGMDCAPTAADEGDSSDEDED